MLAASQSMAETMRSLVATSQGRKGVKAVCAVQLRSVVLFGTQNEQDRKPLRTSVSRVS